MHLLYFPHLVEDLLPSRYPAKSERGWYEEKKPQSSGTKWRLRTEINATKRTIFRSTVRRIASIRHKSTAHVLWNASSKGSKQEQQARGLSLSPRRDLSLRKKLKPYSLRLLPAEFCFVQRRNKVVNLCALDLRSEIRNLIPEERHSFREVTEKKKLREYNQSCYSSSLACFPLASGRTPLHKVRESRFFSLGHFSAVHHHHHHHHPLHFVPSFLLLLLRKEIVFVAKERKHVITRKEVGRWRDLFILLLSIA